MDGYPELVSLGYYNPKIDHIQILWNDRAGGFIDTNNVYVYQNEYSFCEDVRIFPNPTLEKLSVTSEHSEICEITICNLQGIIVYNKKLNSNQKNVNIVLNSRNIKPGIYLCYIKLENNSIICKKLIINQTRQL